MDQPKNTEEKELGRASPLTRTMLESDVIYLKKTSYKEQALKSIIDIITNI